MLEKGRLFFTFLLEIGQGYGPSFMINLDGLDGSGYFLNQGQPLLAILLIGHIQRILKGTAPQSSGIPMTHKNLPLDYLIFSMPR